MAKNHTGLHPRLRGGLRAGAAATAAVLLAAGCGGVKTSSGSDDGGDYPSGSVEMSVGASAGGSSDLISRAVSKGLSDELGASFPVINKEGANGALVANELKSAPTDGSEIAVQNASLFAITPLAVSEDEVTSIDDFDVVYGISRDDYVMVTSKESGFTSLDDLKAAGETLSYGTTGVGTGSQLASVLLFQTAGIKAKSVPFDGGAPNLTALLGNQVDVSTMQIGEASESIESGDLVPLAVFSDERIDFLPDVPTAAEQGVDVSVSQYRFLTTPKGTSDEVKDRLIEGLQATFETEEYQEFNEANSLTPMEIPGDEVVAQLEEDTQRYAQLVQDYGIDLSES
jgi:tripartite-type tricarboxylate transporter receptor subunit TctC